MKKCALFFVFTLSLCFSSNLFAQGVQDFTLVNNTGITIYDLYISEADSTGWGKDILAG